MKNSTTQGVPIKPDRKAIQCPHANPLCDALGNILCTQVIQFLGIPMVDSVCVNAFRPGTYPQAIAVGVLSCVRVGVAIFREDLLTINMSSKKSARFYTGVSLEPEVSAYLDELAFRMRMSRSWVLNTIVHEYAQYIEQKNLTPLASREAVIRL